MLSMIFKDIMTRFGNYIVVGILLLVLCAGVFLFVTQDGLPSLFGPSKGDLKVQVKQKDAVIKQVTENAASEAITAEKHTTAVAASKDNLIKFIQNQGKTVTKFDDVKRKTQNITKPAPAKPTTATESKPQEPDPITLEEIKQTQNRAIALQDAVWDAYDLAVSDIPTL